MDGIRRWGGAEIPMLSGNCNFLILRRGIFDQAKDKGADPEPSEEVTDEAEQVPGAAGGPEPYSTRKRGDIEALGNSHPGFCLTLELSGGSFSRRADRDFCFLRDRVAWGMRTWTDAQS